MSDDQKAIEYAKGYSIGYTKALTDIQDLLVLNQDGSLRLVTIVNWILDKEAAHRENYYKLLNPAKQSKRK